MNTSLPLAHPAIPALRGEPDRGISSTHSVICSDYANSGLTAVKVGLKRLKR